MSLLQQAILYDIEVRIAKRKADFFIDGIHLLNPKIKDLEEALQSALTYGSKIIVIHSEKTWLQSLIHPPVYSLQ